MTPEQQYLYEERWSIRHFDGGQPEAFCAGEWWREVAK